MSQDNLHGVHRVNLRIFIVGTSDTLSVFYPLLRLYFNILICFISEEVGYFTSLSMYFPFFQQYGNFDVTNSFGMFFYQTC